MGIMIDIIIIARFSMIVYPICEEKMNRFLNYRMGQGPAGHTCYHKRRRWHEAAVENSAERAAGGVRGGEPAGGAGGPGGVPGGGARRG